MATHCSVLAWRIPGTAEPGGLPSVGSHRVGHDWSELAAAAVADENLFLECRHHQQLFSERRIWDFSFSLCKFSCASCSAYILWGWAPSLSLALSVSFSPPLSPSIGLSVSGIDQKRKVHKYPEFLNKQEKRKNVTWRSSDDRVCSWSLWGWVCPEADILGRWNELLTNVRSIIYGQWRKAADGFCILETGSHLSITEEYATIRQELPIFPFQLKSQSWPLLSWKDIFPIFQSMPVSPPVSGNPCLKLSPWLSCSN